MSDGDRRRVEASRGSRRTGERTIFFCWDPRSKTLLLFQVKELDFELVAPSLLQHKVITATEYGALSRLPGEQQVGSHFFINFQN